MALRSLRRKSGRTLITVAAMALALALVIFFQCLIQGFQLTFVRSITETESGHLQAHAPGWMADPDLYQRIEALPDEAELARLGWKMAPRLYGWGLAGLNDASSGVEIHGVDLAREAATTRLPAKVASGAWLSAGGVDEVVLGRALAKRLGAKPGDRIVLLSQAADGAMADALFTVKGVMGGVSARVDEAAVFMSEADYRRYLSLESGWHELALRLPQAEAELTAAKATLSRLLPGAEIKDWKELNPVASKMLEMQQVGMLIFMAIAYSAVGMVIFNALLMQVFERIRELGVMKALGATPWQITRLLYWEALFEAALASLLGLGLGLAVSWRVQERGLDLSVFLREGTTVAGLNYEPIMFAKITTQAWARPVFFLFMLVLLATLYPALKAALLRPLKAISHR